MSSILKPFTTKVRTNIDNVLQMTQMINGIMMTGDSRANQIVVELYDITGHVSIPSTVKIVGYFIRGDGYTVEIDGSVNENGEAVVVIPKAVYYVTGALSIAIRMLDDPHSEIVEEHEIVTYGTKIVIAALSCFVQNTETDSIIDPDHHIPDVQELLAYIDVLDEKKEEMITATESIENMTVSATQVVSGGDPTVTITDVDGHKHITFGMVSGKPFSIKRTFASVAEMEAYSGTDVATGDFVIIASTVETPDNAKLYVKTDSGWVFIVDMSGATGIQGPAGPKGDTGAKGDTGDTGPAGPQGPAGADGKDGKDGEDGATGPQGPAGDPGTPGTPGTDGVSAYCYIRWSAAQPTSDSDMKTTPDEWMGIYAGTSATAPSHYQSYQWYKVKGETGSAENVYGNTVPMSSTDSTKVSAAIAGKIQKPVVDGTSGQVLTSDGQGGQSWQTISAGGSDVLMIDCGTITTLPKIVSNSQIESNMICVYSEVSNVIALRGPWEVSTSNGSVTINGVVNGSTTLVIYLAKVAT